MAKPPFFIAQKHYFCFMLKRLKNYINKPTAFIDDKSTQLLMSAFFGLFVFIFLYIFQPFGISKYPDTVLVKCLGYGGVTFIVMLVNAFIMPLVIPKLFDNNTFKVKNNIIISTWFLFSISVANWFYTAYFYPNENTNSLVAFVGITMSVGIFPMLIGSYYMERRLNSNNQKIAQDANNQLQLVVQKNTQSHYSFQSENNSDRIEIEIAHLICIKAEGNYCEFYTLQGGELKKELLRITLKSVEQKLENEGDIIRCHRSYLVNLRKVSKVSGTARNISLHFDNVEFTVPVSRSNSALVTKGIRQMG